MVTELPIAQNVACRGNLVIIFFVFQIYYVLLSFLTPYYGIVTSRGSGKPVSCGCVRILCGYPTIYLSNNISLTVITF